jgi:hypothetical protein
MLKRAPCWLALAAAVGCAVDPPPAEPTDAPLPEDLQAPVQVVMRRGTRCIEARPKHTARLTWELQLLGATKNVDADVEPSDPELQACLLAVLAGVQFPSGRSRFVFSVGFSPSAPARLAWAHESVRQDRPSLEEEMRRERRLFR